MSKPLRKRELQQLSRPLDPRNPTRQRLTEHLVSCGVRPVLECLLDVAAGRPLDEALRDFARIPASTYRALGADDFPNRRWRQ